MAESETSSVDVRVAKLWMANYKSKTKVLRDSLDILLHQKKALNSRVVTQEYEKFKESSDKIIQDNGTPAEVRQTLIGLEKALKKEGLFKNVKAGFVKMKKEFLSTPTSKPAPKPRETVVERPVRGTTSIITHGERKKPQASGETQEVKNLNKAVGRLFDNLKIQKLSEIAREHTGLHVLAQERPATTVKTILQEETDDFKVVIKKVKGLEKELIRQKAMQTSELYKLIEENRGLRQIVSDMKKENDKLKGLQPITKAAKEKQVERMEEQFNKQKKGMEGKITEIESELHKSLEQTLKEKADLELMIMEGVSKLKISITALHKRICGERATHERTKTSMTLDGVRDGKRSIEELIRKVAQIEVEAQLLEQKNGELGQILGEKDTEVTVLRNSLLEITEEVSKLHGSVKALDSSSVQQTDSRHQQGVGHTTLEKLQLINNSIQQYKRVLHEQERNTGSPKNTDDLQPLKQQINKIHDDLLKAVDMDSDLLRDKTDILESRDFTRTSRDRADEINLLLKKLSRVENACNKLREKYEEIDV